MEFVVVIIDSNYAFIARCKKRGIAFSKVSTAGSGRQDEILFCTEDDFPTKKRFMKNGQMPFYCCAYDMCVQNNITYVKCKLVDKLYPIKCFNAV